MRSTIIIPAYNPQEDLLDYIVELSQNGFHSILIVNDGSSTHKSYIFNDISGLSGCVVLAHTHHTGKGSAIKTAVRHIKDNMPESDAVIITDENGGSDINTIKNIETVLQVKPKFLVLGGHNLENLKINQSLFANKLTSKALKVLHSIDVTDANTSIRGIAKTHFDWLLSISGNADDYELNMIVRSKKAGLKVHEIKSQNPFKSDAPKRIVGYLVYIIHIQLKIFSAVFSIARNTASRKVIEPSNHLGITQGEIR